MRSRFLCAFVLFCLVTPAVLHAQNKLPPEAQQAFNLGSAAAQQRQWDLAVKYFSEAQHTTRATPAAYPQILFNLGLAHDKAGHPQAAMIWLHAYLAASSHAANADAVRQEIAQLQIADEARTARILQQALNVATQIENQYLRERTLITLSSEQAFSGDIRGAIRNDPSPEKDEAGLWEMYLKTKAGAGDMQTALEGIYNLGPDPPSPSSGGWNHTIYVLRNVFSFQEKSGDYEGARATVDKMSRLGLGVESRNDLLKDVDSVQEQEAKEPTYTLAPPLDQWVFLALSYNVDLPSQCKADLDLEDALHKADIPPAGQDISQWRQTVVNKLTGDIVHWLAYCSNQIQEVDRRLAWQAAHPRKH